MNGFRAVAVLLPFLSACALGGAPLEELELDKLSAAQSVVDGKADWAGDVCEWSGWYGDDECDPFCARPDPDCDGTPLFHPGRTPTRYPIVLTHGFNASGSGTFARVAKRLRSAGYQVLVANLETLDHVFQRSRTLRTQIDGFLTRTGAARVNIIAHSMGGLDARFLISSLGYGSSVASLTTVGTPHRGTFAADVALGLTHLDSDVGFVAFEALLGRPFADRERRETLIETLRDLSEDYAPGFNTLNPDDPRVHYQSWAGVSSVLGRAYDAEEEACGVLVRNPGTADFTQRILRSTSVLTSVGTTRPSDGLVLVSSAKWGEFRGCVPADHVDLTRSAGDPTTGFEAAVFFQAIADDLGKQGF